MFHVRVNVQQFLSSRFLQRRGGKRLSVPLEIYSRELTNLPKRVQILFRSDALLLRAPRRATFVVLLRVVAPTAHFNKRERDEKERHEQLRIVSFFSRVLSSVLFMEKTPHYKDTQNARRETMI